MGIRSRLWPWLMACALGVGGVSLAQQRPDEDSMFGGAPGEPDAGTPARNEDAMFGGPSADAADAGSGRDEDSMFGSDSKPGSPGTAGTPLGPVGPPTDEPDRDRQVLEGPGVTDAFASEDAVEDPLRIGGLFYLRGVVSYAQNDQFKNISLLNPTLVDIYLDGRPSDRIRAFIAGRMTFDPTIDTANNSAQNALDPEGGVTPTGEGLFTGQDIQNPRVFLDQAWLRFDIARQVFLTIGKQHVKWGTSRFWNPTDFLSPRPRNPLQVFDARTGASMIKLHVPWERYGWNFYAIALLDNIGPSDVLGELGFASRAEIVLGNTELGMDSVFQMGRKPRFGLDISSSLGPVDVYGEVALRGRPDVALWRRRAGADDNAVRPQDFERFLPEGPSPQASGGLNYTFAYSENDTITVGAEYFYNSLGSSDARLYPWLIFNGEFTPFYLGRHYAGFYGVVAAPGNWENTTFVTSVLGNLSDLSFVARVDVTQRVLSFLTVEGFVAGHFGNDRGEFRLGVDIPATNINGFPIPAIYIPPPLIELGIALRVSI